VSQFSVSRTRHSVNGHITPPFGDKLFKLFGSLPALGLSTGIGAGRASVNTLDWGGFLSHVSGRQPAYISHFTAPCTSPPTMYLFKKMTSRAGGMIAIIPAAASRSLSMKSLPMNSVTTTVSCLACAERR